MNDREWWDNEARTDQRYIDGRWGLIGDGSDVEHTIDAIFTLLIKEMCASLFGPVLEIGCGPGRLLKALADFDDARPYYGVDISPMMLDNGQPWGSIFVEMVPGDGTLKGLEGMGFIYSVEVFQHCEPAIVQGYLRSIYEGLMPGGVALLQYVEGDFHQPYNHRYTWDQMTDWAFAAGFSSRTMREGVIHPEWNWMKLVKT